MQSVFETSRINWLAGLTGTPVSSADAELMAWAVNPMDAIKGAT